MGLFANERETIEGTARALRSGETTCIQVLERCLDRIEEWEPRIKAWVAIDRESALEQARDLDAELAAGHIRGPLHGIPIGVKDLIDVAGFPTSAGYPPWKDRTARIDAPMVARLRRSGAIILGKTVATQFAWIDPPVTRNPWDLNRTPGGSSSGSAAAVAAGMCLGAIGTQTGGSIIRPSAFCGVCGFKPPFGDLPVDGVVPLAPSLDHPGPIARSVDDLQTLFRVLQDSQDPGPPPLSDDASPLKECITLDGFFEEHTEPVMTRALSRLLARFEAAGVLVTKHRLPDEFHEVHREHRRIMAFEAAAEHARLGVVADQYQPRIRDLIEEGRAINEATYHAALSARQRAQRLRIPASGGELSQWASIVLTPAAPGPAPAPMTTGDPIFNSPWSFSGHPALTIPIGLAPDGLPLGLQLVSLHGVEPLFQASRWCENLLRHTPS